MWRLTWEVLLVPVAVLLLLLFMGQSNGSYHVHPSVHSPAVNEWIKVSAWYVDDEWITGRTHFHWRTTAGGDKIEEKIVEEIRLVKMETFCSREGEECTELSHSSSPLALRRCNKFKCSQACELMRLSTIIAPYSPYQCRVHVNLLNKSPLTNPTTSGETPCLFVNCKPPPPTNKFVI